MPLYRYHSIVIGGKEIEGIVDADSLAGAKAKLHRNKVLVTKIVPLEDTKKEGKGISSALLLDFTRMLEQLLAAGIPLYESLVIIEERYKSHHRFHRILIDLCDSLKTGISLSDSLKRYTKSFNPIYVSMVKAGEQTGNLSKVFQQICTLLEQQQKIKKKLFSALAYPAFLGVFSLVVFALLLLFVVPSMQPLFQEKDLPFMTRMVFALSNFITTYHSFLSLGVLTLSGVVFFSLRRPSIRFRLDIFLLKLPILGNLLIESAIIRFCRTASLLHLGGIPILQTLQLSRKVLKNKPLEDVIAKVEQKANEGRPLSEELQASSLIPSIVPRMLSISEETGQVGLMLKNIAAICEDSLDKKLSKLMALLQPILLVLLGLGIGVVLLSILIPLSDVGSILQP